LVISLINQIDIAASLLLIKENTMRILYFPICGMTYDPIGKKEIEEAFNLHISQ
jgi:hypothetical protein